MTRCNGKIPKTVLFSITQRSGVPNNRLTELISVKQNNIVYFSKRINVFSTNKESIWKCLTVVFKVKIKFIQSAFPRFYSVIQWRIEIYSAWRRVIKLSTLANFIAVVSSLSLTRDSALNSVSVWRFSFFQLYRTKRQTFDSIMLLLLNVNLRIFRKYLDKNSWHLVLTAVRVSIESSAARKKWQEHQWTNAMTV